VKILVTAGPACEPIDQVRHLTNHSTGALGSQLCRSLKDAGYEVMCLLGRGALVRPDSDIRCVDFTTNDSLLDLLKQEASSSPYTALFHAAALSDYHVARIEDSKGNPVQGLKIPSRSGNLCLHLEPATKVLAQLRGLFPQAKIIGWKYELEGNQASVIAKGSQQLLEARSDAVVLNGKAWGTGFGILKPDQSLEICADSTILCRNLARSISDSSGNRNLV
jgi:phosphopantothenate---cysteine ligase (CTP)